jgi:TolB protein
MRADGTGVQRVVGGAAGSYASDPDWSPDGRSLAIRRWAGSSHGDVWVVGLDGKGLRRVTRTGHSYAPAWSPDGRSIAFSDDGAPRVIAPDGTGMTRLFERADVRDCSGFSWSSDRRIAATCGIPGGLFIARADGDELRVVDRSADRAASWSPDAERLVYGAENGLRIVDANGGSPITIDLRGATASQPDWSPR